MENSDTPVNNLTDTSNVQEFSSQANKSFKHVYIAANHLNL